MDQFNTANLGFGSSLVSYFFFKLNFGSCFSCFSSVQIWFFGYRKRKIILTVLRLNLFFRIGLELSGLNIPRDKR